MSFTASVIPADQWGARSPLNAPFQRTRPRYVVIHHTFTPNPPAEFSNSTLDGSKSFARRIQGWHMDDNGWSDSGHNFLNTTAGILLEGRHGSLSAVKNGLCVQSAHAAQDPGKLAGGNQSPGIENEGTFTSNPMSKTQWESLVALCASLCSSCSIPPANIRGHRDFSNTDCPGDWLYGQLGRLRQEVADILSVSASKPAVPDAVIEDDLQFGSEGPEVVLLQDRLRQKGFPPGASDGDFGDNTRGAVLAFQKSAGLKPDGIVGIKTRAALGL
jgi:Putative peptidoglycan binding domain/N-acetylmuramoyl-L-alanine amidase